MKSPVRLLYLIPVMIIITGCHTSRKSTPSASGTYNDAQPKAAAQILFLDMQFMQDSAHRTRGKLLKTTIVEGRLKTLPVSLDTSRARSYLICNFTAKNGETVEILFTEHPLHKEVEYPADEKHFERKIIHLQDAEFSVRMNYNPQIVELVIYEVVEKKTPVKITTIRFAS